MRRIGLGIFLIVFVQAAFAAYEVKKVDLLASAGMRVNGAGPLLVRLDPQRNRLAVAHSLTSSVSLIDCGSHSVRNIPIGSRVPHYLKSEALTIDSRSGNIYIIGNRTLEVVFPDSGRSRTFPTRRQFEMVAVDEASGNAFLVGRESRDLAWVDLKQGRVSFIPWSEMEETAQNLNQTPPPPLRKVVCDQRTRTILAVDGTTSSLHRFQAASGKRLQKRSLALQSGGRWHYAGYSPERQALFLVVETAERKVVQAAKIAAVSGDDIVVALPGFTEGVGICYDEGRDEIYIPYDNHPSLHVVDFKDIGPSGAGTRPSSRLSEVKLPAYGNDASALDAKRGLLYISSWAYGEIDQVDLQTRQLRRRFQQPAVLPHMFHMAFNPNDGKLYVPLGATAVNGSFGAAVSVFDPQSGVLHKVRTGWAPQELLQLPGSESFLVFDNEDRMALVAPDGTFNISVLPVAYPHQALTTPAGNVYLSYGPHQSYWPVVYIWAARNGILGIDGKDFSLYDRRIPRLAQGMALAPSGALYALQNNWGDEKQFYIALADEVRAPNQGDMRVELEDTVSRETSQRLIAFDDATGWLLLVRVGEKDGDRGILQIVDAGAQKVVQRLEVGVTPTSLHVDEKNIYVANFDSDSLTVVDKSDFRRRDLKCGRQPLKLALASGIPYVINHGDNTLSEFAAPAPQKIAHSGSLSSRETPSMTQEWLPRKYKIPFPGRPDQVAWCHGLLWLASHSAEELFISTFDPLTAKFTLRHREKYPYGETVFTGNNSSFFMRGQFGDCIYDLCKIRAGAGGRVWISDFLAGKVFIFNLRK